MKKRRVLVLVLPMTLGLTLTLAMAYFWRYVLSQTAVATAAVSSLATPGMMGRMLVPYCSAACQCLQGAKALVSFRFARLVLPLRD